MCYPGLSLAQVSKALLTILFCITACTGTIDRCSRLNKRRRRTEYLSVSAIEDEEMEVDSNGNTWKFC